jgi:transcriptional regulator with XRE-family HTH domain
VSVPVGSRRRVCLGPERGELLQQYDGPAPRTTELQGHQGASPQKFMKRLLQICNLEVRVWRVDGHDCELDRHIAERLRQHREDLGLSLGELAERSGVSKAMLSRIENNEARPTASLLGRVCAGLGVTLSSLIASVEHVDVQTWRAAKQPVFRDKRAGLVRKTVGTPLAWGGFDITRIYLDTGAVVHYDVAPHRPVNQYLVLLSGSMEFSLGSSVYALHAGDCLGARVDRPSAFHVTGTDPVEYLVITDRTAS